MRSIFGRGEMIHTLLLTLYIKPDEGTISISPSQTASTLLQYETSCIVMIIWWIWAKQTYVTVENMVSEQATETETRLQQAKTKATDPVILITHSWLTSLDYHSHHSPSICTASDDKTTPTVKVIKTFNVITAITESKLKVRRLS